VVASPPAPANVVSQRPHMRRSPDRSWDEISPRIRPKGEFAHRRRQLAATGLRLGSLPPLPEYPTRQNLSAKWRLTRMFHTGKPGARTFLSAATYEGRRCAVSRPFQALSYCCGQECPRAGLLVFCARHEISRLKPVARARLLVNPHLATTLRVPAPNHPTPRSSPSIIPWKTAPL